MHLLIIILALLVDYVEESELVGALACSDHTQPVSKLLLLEELLGPTLISLSSSLLSFATHKYLRYRPENGMCVTTSILPSPDWLMLTLSPKLPVRPSILMRSCKNFSNAAKSKILSETGCEQSMMYLEVVLVLVALALEPRAYGGTRISLLLVESLDGSGGGSTAIARAQCRWMRK